jgi:hypothetical protein
MISQLQGSTDYPPLSKASADARTDLRVGAKKDAVLTLWVDHIC